MSEIRCECHNLLAKSNDGKIEILCRRCKRTHIIFLDQRLKVQSPDITEDSWTLRDSG